MKKLILPGILLIAFASFYTFRNHEKYEKAKAFGQLMQENLWQFRTCNVFTKDSIEIWGIHRKNDCLDCWTHDLKTDSVIFDREHFVFGISSGRIPADFPYEEMMRKIHNRKKELGIVQILQQSKWIGCCVKFFFTESECVMYLTDNFKPDDLKEQKCLDEFKSGTFIDSNWVYIK